MSSSFPLEGLRVRIAGETDRGRKRAHNEDTLHLPVDERVVLVADGMGGHACGDVASRLAVATVAAHLSATVDEQDATWPFHYDRDRRRHESRLVTAIRLANAEIYQAARRDSALRGMGTTLVAGLFCDDEVVLAHVGDSRIYRLRDGCLTQLTEDHSLLNDYIRMKRIDRRDAERFPQKNVIVRALGMKDAVGVDTRREVARLGDLYLFCSDGLSGMVSDTLIEQTVVAEEDLDRGCERLIALANEAGGTDNITVVLARLEPA